MKITETSLVYNKILEGEEARCQTADSPELQDLLNQNQVGN
jgi:hypothetical protein